MPTKNINSFIGIGTGRCGTKSLAKVVGSCHGWKVQHEGHLADWYNPSPATLNHLVMFLQQGWRGEVSLNLLPHVEYLRERIPGLKVVHIWREKHRVVSSFLVNHSRISRLLPEMHRDAVIDARNKNKYLVMNPMAGMPEIFPKFPEASGVVDSYEKYYDYYIEEANKIPDVYTLYAPDLAKDDKLDLLYQFLEIPKEDRAYPIKRVYS